MRAGRIGSGCVWRDSEKGRRWQMAARMARSGAPADAAAQQLRLGAQRREARSHARVVHRCRAPAPVCALTRPRCSGRRSARTTCIRHDRGGSRVNFRVSVPVKSECAVKARHRAAPALPVCGTPCTGSPAVGQARLLPPASPPPPLGRERWRLHSVRHARPLRRAPLPLRLILARW